MSGWEIFVTYGSIFSPIIPLLFVWKRLNLYQIVIVTFIVLSFSTDLLTVFVIKGYNLHYIRAWGFVEALLLFLFYSIVLDRSKKWITALTIVFVVLYLFDSFWLKSYEFNTLGRSIECFIFIVLSVLLFYQFFRKEDDIFIEHSPLFWINIAILAYFSGAFFSYVLSNMLLVDSITWIFHNISNILKNLLLAVGLWKVRVN